MKKSFLLIFIFCFAALMLVTGYAEEGSYKFVNMWGSKGSGNGQFQYVEDFAFDANGNLLATDALNSNVQVFTKDGKYITQFGKKGKGKNNDELEKPEGIAVDGSGNIYVADYVSGYIKKFNRNYKWVKTFSSYGTAAGSPVYYCN